MYRERLVSTDTSSSQSARALQAQLLDWHDFRHQIPDQAPAGALQALATWQAERLKKTHEDLYKDPGYRPGLVFLLTDLYAPASMTRRDDNIDRIFPRMVTWLPDNLLATLAALIELNHVTQKLDLALLENLSQLGADPARMDTESYCTAFRAGDISQRMRQIELVEKVGRQLDSYVRNRTLGWLLSMSRAPAEMARMEDLHSFLHRGYRAFRAMDRVDALISELVIRESLVLEQIMSGQPDPLALPGSLDRGNVRA